MNKETYINNIPQELKECKQWLWFKIYHNEDKNRKYKNGEDSNQSNYL